MAFVEYQDVRYAAQAMATLQGSFLLSSDRGAIRIEYAKSKMAEVGFTNLWIEVGFTLCYDRRVARDAGTALFAIGQRFFFVLEEVFDSISRTSKIVPRESHLDMCGRILAKVFLAYTFA